MVWFSNCGLKTRQKMSVLWSIMSGIQMVCLITWSNHLKTGQKSVGKVKCLDFRCSVFRWLLSLFSNYHELSLSRDVVRGCSCGCPRRGRSRWALGRTSDPRWRIRLSRLVSSSLLSWNPFNKTCLTCKIRFGWHVLIVLFGHTRYLYFVYKCTLRFKKIQENLLC